MGWLYYLLAQLLLRYDQKAAALRVLREAANKHLWPQSLTLSLLGKQLLQQGESREAALWLRQAVLHKPSFANRLALSSALLLEGALHEAQPLIMQLCEQQPNNPRPQRNAGLYYELQGDIDTARRYYEQIIIHHPTYLPAQLSLGIVKRDEGDFSGAISIFLQIINHEPNNIHCLINLAETYKSNHDYNQAIYFYKKALLIQPTQYNARVGVIRALLEVKHPDEAINYAYDAKTLFPNDPLIGCLVGDTLRMRHFFDLAQQQYQIIIEQHSSFTRAYVALAQLLRDRRQFTVALKVLDDALQRRLTDDTSIHDSRGQILTDMGEFDAARQAYHAAFAIAPTNPTIAFNKGLCDLLTGHYQEGWLGYQHRFASHAARERKAPEYSLWQGEPLGGRYLLILAEQGIGDEMMFASCFNDIARISGARLIIECAKKLAPIFEHSFPQYAIYAANQKDEYGWTEQYDIAAWIMLGDLPRFCRNHRESFPNHQGYLSVDAERVYYWQERLNQLGHGLKVGLSWVGGTKDTRRKWRSIALHRLKTLFKIDHVHFISLQYTNCQPEINALKRRYGYTVHHWQEAIDDYNETAALVSALDVVISVQTAVVHLAGALGKEAWVMVRANPEWRYGLEPETIAWYPSVRLFRQSDKENWDSVIHCIADELVKNGLR
ncbi:hypothetical protein D5085_17150 [Ectothiorhodospiraceae bacterium BW-2]|nr:hypothetical protein D5085_17150 [Ectothiorhodospiraceae bacterium BW-2]